MSKRSHSRITGKSKADKSPEVIIVKTSTNNPVGKGILYPIHIENAKTVTPLRKKVRREKKILFFKGISTEDPEDTEFLLTEAEADASILAYDMNIFLRPAIDDYEDKHGKIIDKKFLEEMKKFDSKQVDELATLLIDYEGWSFRPKKTTIRKLRKEFGK